MVTFLYDLETGKGMGVTVEPENYSCGKTTIEPPVIDDFTQELYFIDSVWEVRELEE